MSTDNSLRILCATCEEYTDPLQLFDEWCDEWDFPNKPIQVVDNETNSIEIIKSDYDLTCWFGLNDGRLNKFTFRPIIDHDDAWHGDGMD